MSPEESITAYIPRIVLIFCLIISLSVLVGSMSYLMKNGIRTAPIKKNELAISTDKTEYIQGEEIGISIKNNKENEVFLFFPSIEVFEPADGNAGDGRWKAIRMVWSGCGVAGGLKYLPLAAGGSYVYSWDQKEKWCEGESWDTVTDSEEVRGGKYRISGAMVKKTKTAEEDPNNISGQLTDNFIYSNEFIIKERSAVYPRCSQKVEFVPCRGDGEGYEFDNTINTCVKRLYPELCTKNTPFVSLEECQNACETKIDFYSCNVDSDCIPVKADCCGCNAGGRATAINNKFIFEWNKQFGCAGIACPAVMSDDPSCFGTPKCINSECVLE